MNRPGTALLAGMLVAGAVSVAGCASQRSVEVVSKPGRVQNAGAPWYRISKIDEPAKRVVLEPVAFTAVETEDGGVEIQTVAGKESLTIPYSEFAKLTRRSADVNDGAISIAEGDLLKAYYGPDGGLIDLERVDAARKLDGEEVEPTEDPELDVQRGQEPLEPEPIPEQDEGAEEPGDEDPGEDFGPDVDPLESDEDEPL